MTEQVTLNTLNLPDLYPTLLHKDGRLLRQPSTVIQLRAANQYLRAQPDFEISVDDSSMSVRRGEISGVLTCSVYGQNAHSFGWGSTVEGVTPEQDIVEPHLVLNPHNDGILLHYESPPNSLTPDVAVLGFVEG